LRILVVFRLAVNVIRVGFVVLELVRVGLGYGPVWVVGSAAGVARTLAGTLGDGVVGLLLVGIAISFGDRQTGWENIIGINGLVGEKNLGACSWHHNLLWGCYLLVFL
jgi:hypothetical protein